MAKKSHYPSSPRARKYFWIGVSTGVLTVAASLALAPDMRASSEELDRWLPRLVLGVLMSATYLLMSYVMRDNKSRDTEASRYETAILRLESISSEFEALGKFLKEERRNIVITEDAVRNLRAELSNLEPVVAANREVIEKVLSAYANRTARQAWTERALGFLIGVASSVLASIIVDLFKR